MIGGTLLTFEHETFNPGFYTPEGEAKRQAVKHSIRSSGAYGVMYDFYRVISATAHPARMLLAWSAVHGFSTLFVEGQCTQAFGLDVGDAARASAAASQVLTLLSPALSSQAIAASPKRKSSRL